MQAQRDCNAEDSRWCLTSPEDPEGLADVDTWLNETAVQLHNSFWREMGQV